MRVLVIGSQGFIGSAVCRPLEAAGHEVHGAANVFEGSENEREHFLNLTDKPSIVEVLKKVNPEAIVSCAGIVENSEKARLNVTFTDNLLQAVLESGVKPDKIVTCGSAAEYGIVRPEDIPVREDTERNPNSLYGTSKRDETDLALRFKEEHGLPVIVARIFNPIGSGMHPRMLIPNLIAQAAACKAGERDSIEISRKDSQRDYLDVRDLAEAMCNIVEQKTSYDVYNLGSGIATSNEDLVRSVMRCSELPDSVTIVETSAQPEAQVASQADISRLREDFGWMPKISLEDAIKDIVYATR